MKLQADKVEQIAAQLLAGMLANPHIYHVHPTISEKLNRGQQEEELVIAAIAMAEALVTKVETRIEKADYPKV